jgi:Na+-translocating ferredoxin:NAD+ oxidoreductase subunit B
MDIAVQTAIIGGIGLVCAAILAVASKFLAVQEDPRIEQLTAILPGANCGGCGFAGCAAYAEAIIKHGADANLCTAGGTETVHQIAKFLGIEAVVRERQVALVLCGGNNSVARRVSHYNGVADCASAELVAGGGKACRYGCMGFGSCARACPVGAIEIAAGLAVVHPQICTGCGKCVATCPRKLIKLVPESRSIHVLCASPERGPDVKKVCDVGCIGCTLCAKAVNNQGITMKGALAVVDYAIPVTSEEPVAKCPQKTIVKRPGIRKEGAA